MISNALALLLAATCSSPAWAQAAGRFGLQSDYEVRGASITHGRPVADLDLSYDLPLGFYMDGSAFGALADGRYPGLVGLIGDAGYAQRLNAQISVDGGVTRSQYIDVAKNGYSNGYTEIYGGLASRHLLVRLYYSPDYFRSDVRTLYGEIGGNIGFVAGIRLNAHLGSLDYLDRPAGFPPPRTQYDWRLGASRQFGAFDLHLSISGGGPNQDYQYQEPRAQTEVIGGAGYTF